MFSKRFVAASAVAVTSFAAIAGEPPASLKAADPAAQVSQTTYTSAFSTYIPAATDNVSPDKVWKEANATVASEGMHGGAHAGHAPTAQGAGSHSGHTMTTQGATSGAHAGHGMSGMITDEQLEADLYTPPYYRPAEDSAEYKDMMERRAALVAARRARAATPGRAPCRRSSRRPQQYRARERARRRSRR